MNRLMTRQLAIAFSIFCFCTAGLLQAQSDGHNDAEINFPIVPMTVRFQFVPQYFVQLIRNDQRYGSIEALIDTDSQPPWYEVILTDKTTGRRIFYLNSVAAVDTLRNEGTIAHYAAIEFSAVERPDPNPTYKIALHDSYGQEITWKFAVNPRVAESATRFVPPLGAPGFVVMHADCRFGAAPGTAVMIGKESDTAEVLDPTLAPNSVSYRAFWAKDTLMAEIAPGTARWIVDSSPAQIKGGEKWSFHGNGGMQRNLMIEKVSGDQLQIQQVDQGNPFSPHAQLDVLRLGNSIMLRSVVLLVRSHELRLSFQPAMPLPIRQLKDRTDSDFVIAEDEEPIAQGKVSVERALETEHILWRFDSPTWARTNSFDSGVNLIH